MGASSRTAGYNMLGFSEVTGLSEPGGGAYYRPRLLRAFDAASRNLGFVTGLRQEVSSDKNIRNSDHGVSFTTLLSYHHM